jgi:hypothetical protein
VTASLFAVKQRRCGIVCRRMRGAVDGSQTSTYPAVVRKSRRIEFVPAGIEWVAEVQS